MKYLIILLGMLSMSYSQWIQKYWVDEFGDKTNEKYIVYYTENGTFSNSATSNSKLIAKVIVHYISDDSLPNFRFDLYEYGRGPAVGKAIGNADYELAIKLSDNTTEIYYLDAGEHSLYISKSLDGVHALPDRFSFSNHLKKESKPIKCYIIINSEYGVCGRYNFKINPAGFSNALSKIKPK